MNTENKPNVADDKQTITKPSTEKEKNPKRVAQGKRLAEQSRIFKQKAKENRYNKEIKDEETDSNVEDQEPWNFSTVLAVLGTGACLASTFFTYKQWANDSAKRGVISNEPSIEDDKQKAQEKVKKVEKVEKVEKVKTNYKNLDKLGL